MSPPSKSHPNHSAPHKMPTPSKSHSNPTQIPLKPKPHNNMSPLEIPFKSIARRLINASPLQIPFKSRSNTNLIKFPPSKS